MSTISSVIGCERFMNAIFIDNEHNLTASRGIPLEWK